jgi:2-keto-4-pentenoate hydratase/2-oxohepta-3-ene-1,7-dioic acid hydratase in catechol pathway
VVYWPRTWRGLDGESGAELAAVGAGASTRDASDLSSSGSRHPCPTSKVIALGRNYPSHAAEQRARQ